MKKQLLALKKSIFALSLLIPLAGNTQAVINVNVLSMSFFPASITIDVGDTVRWTSASGTHNVNGTIATYPSNPESFGNSLSSGWTYSHKFLTEGSYDYRCDQHFSSGMVGTITVLPTGGIKELNDGENFVKVFPNPATDELNVSLLKNISIEDYVIYDLSGTEVIRGTFSNKILVDQLNQGVYFLSFTGDKTLRVKILID